jgi:hypothetical protein
MASLSFKLDQLFELLIPFGFISIPSEPDFVQKFLLIKSNFAILVLGPLGPNPSPK